VRLISKKPVMLEVHSFRNRIDYICIRRLLCHFSVKFVSITNQIRKEMIESHPKLRDSIIVLSDGHEFDYSSSTFDSKFGVSATLSIGYFGSLGKNKGVEYLTELCGGRFARAVKFNIYTQDIHLVPSGSNIGEVRCLNHSACFEKMKEQDVLLVFVTPMAIDSDIGRYTSPLKLFEYAASGKPIIASNLEILREVLVDEQNAVLIEHNLIDFSKALDKICSSEQLRKNLHTNALKLAERTTWTSRARKILEFVELQP
jgi:glycosyltransferase involved in cell wall biosynthesis